MKRAQPKIPASAQSIYKLNNFTKLSIDLMRRFKNAYKNRRTSDDPESVTENYERSWRRFLNERSWENYDNLSDFLNPPGSHRITATLNDHWMNVPRDDFLRFRIQTLRHTLESHMPKGIEPSVLIEAGCGWGRNLFCLRAAGYAGPLKGYELTTQAVEAARAIAAHFNISDITFEQANLITDVIPAENSVVYTYHCLEQIKYNTKDVLKQLIAGKPSRVIHFEPVPELFKLWRPRDLVNYAYNRVADYQSSLFDVLKEMQENGEVKILYAKRQGYYQLPVQETTCLVWDPLNFTEL